MDAVKLLGSLMGSNATGGNLLGSLLGGGGGGGGGGLGALAGLLGGGGGGGGGGLGALAGMLGGGGGGGGGLGGMLAGLAGGGQQRPEPQAQEQDQAVLMVRAMCNAAKADGQIDRQEVENIMGRLGNDIDQAEAQFLQQELEAPIDLGGFLASVPDGLEEQVYAFSLMGMKLDTQQEAKYLGAVAEGLRMNPQTCNQIHAKLGAPEIFK